MVVFYLRNSRIPSGKIVPVTVALNKEVILGAKTTARPDQNPVATGTYFPNLLDYEGEEIWIITLSTRERDADGDPIPPEVINVLSESHIHIELEAALGRIGRKIDWGTPLPDTQAPQLIEINPPLSQTSNVPISSNVILRLQDPLPAAGMDLSTLNLTLNGFPVVTSGLAAPGMDVDIRGNVFDLTIIHRPRRIT